MDELLKKYHLAQSRKAFVQVEEFIRQQFDMMACLRVLSAYTVIYKCRDFEKLILELLNEIPSTREIEIIVERLLLLINLESLKAWPTERQKVKYYILNGLALCHTDFQVIEHFEEAYFSALPLDKLLKYFKVLNNFIVYQIVVGKKLMESTDYWDYFRCFPFSEYFHSKTLVSQINQFYFEISSIESVYNVEAQIVKKEEMTRFYFILSEKYEKYPEWRKHFEWFIFKHSVTLSSPLEIGLHNWDFIFDRIEGHLFSNPEGPRMLEVALSKSNMPSMASFFQPIIFDLLRKRYRSEDFYVLPLMRVVSKDKSEGFLKVLINYASLDSLKIREASLEMLLKIMKEMESTERLPFVAQIWDILASRKDSTCYYLKRLAELECIFLEPRIAKLPEGKKKFI